MTEGRIRRLGYDEDADAGHSRWSRLGARLAMLVVLVGVGWATYQALFANRGEERMIQTVELLGPTPEQEKEPEPEPPPELEEEIEVPEVDVRPPGPEDAAPSDNRLGLDVEAGVGGDGFGLMAKKGGRDVTTIGSDGGGGNPLLLQAFVSSMRAEIQRRLNDHLDLRERPYVAIVKLWVRDDGAIERFEVPQPTGHQDMDAALERALAELGRVAEPPPGTPQPVWLRIRSSKMTG